MKKSSCLLTVCIALAISGCSSPDKGVVGSWSAVEGNVLVLKADHTFEQTSPNAPFTGTWALTGKKVNLTVEKVKGKSLDDALIASGVAPDQVAKIKAQAKKIELVLSSDGRSLVGTSPGGQSVTLLKVDSK